MNQKHGDFSYVELMCRQSDDVGEFFKNLFGWTITKNTEVPPEMNYQMVINHGQVQGGIMQMGKEFPAELPAHWCPYVAVDDIEASFKKATDLGAKACMQIQAIPGDVGRFALLTGPDNVFFAIIQYNKKG